MSTISVVLSVVQVIVSLGLIATVLLQSGASAGLSGTIAGAGETFFGMHRSMDEKFAKMTKALGVAFFVITLIIALVQ